MEKSIKYGLLYDGVEINIDWERETVDDYRCTDSPQELNSKNFKNCRPASAGKEILQVYELKFNISVLHNYVIHEVERNGLFNADPLVLFEYISKRGGRIIGKSIIAIGSGWINLENEINLFEVLASDYIDDRGRRDLYETIINIGTRLDNVVWFNSSIKKYKSGANGTATYLRNEDSPNFLVFRPIKSIK